MLSLRKIVLILLILVFITVIHKRILTAAGSFLVLADIPERADAAVVLHTGVDIYPRLVEAAALYKGSKVDKVVINGNRKTDTLRNLEKSGYEPPCKWYAEELGVLSHLGVPKDHVVAISAENAFDTFSEAKNVGRILINNGLTDIIITTSRYHSRRAYHIWRSMYRHELAVHVAPARDDPFSPDIWWKKPRQIRWVLSEYGAWLYYYWLKLFD